MIDREAMTGERCAARTTFRLLSVCFCVCPWLKQKESKPRLGLANMQVQMTAILPVDVKLLHEAIKDRPVKG